MAERHTNFNNRQHNRFLFLPSCREGSVSATRTAVMSTTSRISASAIPAPSTASGNRALNCVAVRGTSVIHCERAPWAFARRGKIHAVPADAAFHI
jgi:hypothetical protein